MNKKTQKNLDGEKNLRDVSISRRGGVRTRGGRLPPINMRDIGHVIGTKKTVMPNIPQRRAVVKKEISQDASGRPLQLKTEPRDDSSSTRRGRAAKVFLQTEGSFLAEGPAARLKRDPVSNDVGFSKPRASAKGGDCERKYDPAMIKDVLNTYDAKSFYGDDFGNIPPHRFPLLRETPVLKIKSEPEDDDYTKVKIKSEASEEVKSKTDYTKLLRTTEYFQDVENDAKLILLKLPSNLPFMQQAAVTDSDDKVKEKSAEVEQIDIQNGGFIGKLRFMRSGRIKLVLGDVELEFTDVIPLESYMEVATIRVQQDMADLNILGKIDKRVVLSPTLNRLVENGNQQLSQNDVQ